MAKIKNSPIHISGRFGDMVFCNGSERGPYVRRRPEKKEPSTAQLSNIRKLQLAINFLYPVSQLLALGWKESSKKTAVAYDRARSYLLKNSFNEDAEVPQISYKNVTLSKGNLYPAAGLNAELQDTRLTLTWLPLPALIRPDYSETTLAVYQEELQCWIYFTRAGTRADLKLDVELPEGLLNGTLHIYLFFISDDRKQASLSTYFKLEKNDRT